MSQPTLMAEPRTVVGKKVKRLRKDGFVPGVVYGPTLENTVQVSISSRDFEKFFRIYGHATLFDLECDGEKYPAFIRDVQIDPVRRDALHVDFFSPNLLKAIDASVPLAFINHPEGEGIFTTSMSEIVLHGLPAVLPSRITVDCSSLEAIGDTIRVADLEIPGDVTLVTHEEDLVAMISAETVEPEPEEEVEGEEGEVVEGEEGEAEAAEAAEADSDSGEESE